jgi:hypothetical protein
MVPGKKYGRWAASDVNRHTDPFSRFLMWEAKQTLFIFVLHEAAGHALRTTLSRMIVRTNNLPYTPFISYYSDIYCLVKVNFCNLCPTINDKISIYT